MRAGVWLFSLFRRNQTQEDGQRFATGLRNMVALDINRRDGRLYGVQQGRDQLFENWPQLYTREKDAVLLPKSPSESSAATTTDGRTANHDPARGKVLAPEYGGNDETAGRCADVKEPLTVLPVH